MNRYAKSFEPQPDEPRIMWPSGFDGDAKAFRCIEMRSWNYDGPVSTPGWIEVEIDGDLTDHRFAHTWWARNCRGYPAVRILTYTRAGFPWRAGASAGLVLRFRTDEEAQAFSTAYVASTGKAVTIGPVLEGASA